MPPPERWCHVRHDGVLGELPRCSADNRTSLRAPASVPSWNTVNPSEARATLPALAQHVTAASHTATDRASPEAEHDVETRHVAEARPMY